MTRRILLAAAFSLTACVVPQMTMSPDSGGIVWVDAGPGGPTDSGTPIDSGSPVDSGTSPTDSGMTPTDGGAPSACDLAWSTVTTLYPGATNLTSCEGNTAATPIVSSLMNLSGITIDNNGVEMTPCIETKCDSNYVYIASNSLPHYDFVQTTPNALNEVTIIYRIPMQTTAVGGNGTDSSTLKGCQSAYTAYTTSNPTTSEPSGYCNGNGTYFDTLHGGVKASYEELACLGPVSVMISGPPICGPNEAQVPDPWGNPAYYWPALAGESYVPTNLGQGAALDLCGGHTSNVMHYHGVNEACFARDATGHPANSYVAATQNWNFADLIDGTCTAESGVIGWSYDGYPIMGPCVCTQRNGDGSCATLKRARSSWSYGGLSKWATGTVSSTLSKEGMACSADTDCCGSTGTCSFKCSFAIFDDSSAAGTTEGQRCVLKDYSWCANQFEDRTTDDVSTSNFVYMDRCNGFDGPDGYRYYATGSFPFLVGCYHGAPTASNTGSMGGMMGMGGMDAGMMPRDGGGMPPRDGGMMGPPDGGMMPRDGGAPPIPDGGMAPMCMPGQTSHCCGDGVCDGPENHQNCPEDCP